MKTKIFSATYFLIFAAFAFVQLNDPDPLFWASIYGLVALASLVRTFGISNEKAFLVLTILLVVCSLFYIPGFIEYLAQPDKNQIMGEMVYKKPYIEETREFLGLWLAAAANFHQYKLKG